MEINNFIIFIAGIKNCKVPRHLFWSVSHWSCVFITYCNILLNPPSSSSTSISFSRRALDSSTSLGTCSWTECVWKNVPSLDHSSVSILWSLCSGSRGREFSSTGESLRERCNSGSPTKLTPAESTTHSW